MNRAHFCELAVGASSRHAYSEKASSLVPEYRDNEDVKEDIHPELLRYRKYRSSAHPIVYIELTGVFCYHR